MYSAFLASREKGPKWPDKFTIRGDTVMQSRSTRRMKRLAYKLSKTLRRIKKLLARQAAIAANLETRRSVKRLKAAKRLPQQRVRSMDLFTDEKVPDPVTYYRNAVGGLTSIGLWPLSRTATWGIRRAIVDVKPILLLDPPHSPVTIGSVRVNSLKAAIDLVPAIKSRPIHRQPMSKWPWKGLQNHGILTTLPQPISFDMSNANKALQGAIAKVYEADLNSNEYIVEWRQVIGLLRDPLKTVKVFHKVLERWTRRDAWIWVPQRRYRKFGKGTLVSRAPTGGVLMSMRTKRELDPSTVSKTVLNAACNRWLQYRYGIVPLMSDLTTVYGLWLEPIQPPRLKSKSARYWVQKSVKTHSTYSLRQGPFDCTFKRVKTTGEFYAAKVWYNKQEDKVPTSYKYGMHPSQFVNVLWNATPYSFCADWVINHDEWMTSQRHVPWIQLQGNVVTRKVFESFRTICVSAQDINYGERGVITGTPLATIHLESINRKVDLPRTMEPFLSTAWTSVKNAMTAATLVLSPILTESLSKRNIKR